MSPMLPAPPSMFPAALTPFEQERLPFRGIPQPPQSLRSESGSLEATLFWNSPQNLEGIAGWRVFRGNESTLMFETKDPNLRQLKVKMAGGGAKEMFYISSVSELGRESPKIGVLAASTTDQMVVSGTGGATAGTSSQPSGDWLTEPSGGKYWDQQFISP